MQSSILKFVIQNLFSEYCFDFKSNDILFQI